MSKNNKLKGIEFEKSILNRLPDGKFKFTCNSGAKHDDADIRSSKYLIECKVKSSKNFKHSNKELSKLIKQANKLGKDWIYITKNDNNKEFALMSFDTLLDMLHNIASLQNDYLLLSKENNTLANTIEDLREQIG